MRMQLALPLAILLASCSPDETVSKPQPSALLEDANGYFCMMNLAEHAGPKAQIFIEDRDDPIWFPSVRDALTFRLLPGEAGEILAIYVSDTAAGPTYEKIDPEVWIDADNAVFVINSDKSGGMGVGEAVPFANREGAEEFVQVYGGRMVALSDIPVNWVFAEMEAGS